MDTGALFEITVVGESDYGVTKKMSSGARLDGGVCKQTKVGSLL